MVKADGYGHGAAPVARAAMAAGAGSLAVAQVAEATALRAAGIAAPILLLSEPRPADLAEVLAADVAVTVYTPDLIARLGAMAESAGRSVAVHLKVDTGMHRVGAAPADLVGLAKLIDAEACALARPRCGRTARSPTSPTTPSPARQLERFDAAVAAVEAAGIPVPHAARRQLRRGHRPSGQPVRPRALRHRPLRDRPVAADRAIASRWSPWCGWPPRSRS